MNKNLKSESKNELVWHLEISVRLNQEIYDKCKNTLQRLAMQEGTFDSSKMYAVRQNEFDSVMDIFMSFFPGKDVSEVLEVIKFEQ